MNVELPQHCSQSLRHRRRGFAYVVFAGLSLAVAVIGISSLTYARVTLRTQQAAADMITARYYAQAAVQLGYLIMFENQNPSWRTTPGVGIWLNVEPFETGSMTGSIKLVAAIDTSDGDGIDGNDPVTFVATGTQGNARHIITVRLVAAYDNGGLIEADSDAWTYTPEDN